MNVLMRQREKIVDKPHRASYLVAMKSYTLKDITRVLGVKRTALQQWVDRGYISPSIQTAGGQGNKNLWSKKDLFSLAVFQELLKHGFTREEAAVFLRERKTLRGGKVCDRMDSEPEMQRLFGAETYAVQLVSRSNEISAVIIDSVEDDIFEQLDSLMFVHAPISSAKIVNLTEVYLSVEKML